MCIMSVVYYIYIYIYIYIYMYVFTYLHIISPKNSSSQEDEQI